MNKKNNKNLIMFIPSIEGGGVEKNFFLISNYLIKKFDNLTIITISRKQKKNFDKSIKFVSLSSNRWENSGRGLKYILAIILLIKEILKIKIQLFFHFKLTFIVF